MDNKRYVVHNFIYGSPIFVDRLRKTLTFYKNNLSGQIYNLNNPKFHIVSTAKINGLIRRTNGGNYNFTNSFSADGYIYSYLMTTEQEAKCGRTPEIPGWDKLIVKSDDYAEAIKTMCEWVYEHHFPKDMGDKEAQRGRMLKYCREFLSGRHDEPPKQQAVTAKNSHDRYER